MSENDNQAASGNQAALRDELRTVEEELAQLRESVAELRRSSGSRSDGADEPEDVTVVIAEAEEQETLIEVLETRRDGLLNRLGQH
jgi:hypothetical protein